MTKHLFLFTAVAAAVLAGCDNSDQNLVQGEPGNTATANGSSPVVLPPSIIASKIYRCKDNGVVYIDWLSDQKSVNLRTARDGDPTVLTALEAGGKLVAEGYALTGTSADASVTLERPGRGSQACKA